MLSFSFLFIKDKKIKGKRGQRKRVKNLDITIQQSLINQQKNSSVNSYSFLRFFFKY